MGKPIMVFYGEISGRLYATAAWKSLGEGKFEVTGEKYDVTDQIAGIIAKHKLSFAEVGADDNSVRLDELHRVRSGANDAAFKRTPEAGSRELTFYDFDYYIYLRECELKGQKPLDTYEEYLEAQR